MARMRALYANEMSAPGLTKNRKVGAVLAFADARLAAGHVAFSMSQLVEGTALTRSAAKSQLRRLSHKIVRISKAHPFFVIVSPEHGLRGSPPVDSWLDDYFQWLDHPYYLALQSAASAYGSNPQSIQVIQVMTDKPRRPVTVGQLHIVFFVKRSIQDTPTQQLANAFAPTRVSTPAATAFDLIRYAARIGGIGRTVETLRPLLPLIDQTALRGVLEAEDETATAQRLGYILEKTGKPKLAAVVEHWLPAKRPTIPLATMSANHPAGPVASPWRIVDNSGEFQS